MSTSPGDSAYPIDHAPQPHGGTQARGLTKREYFAGQVHPAIVTAMRFDRTQDRQVLAREAAKIAVDFADELIKALNT